MGRDVTRGGFSIVEIMVSLLLVAVALMAIASVFPRITAHQKVIREVEDGYMIAAHVLDSLYQESLADPSPFSIEAGDPPIVISGLDPISRNNTSFLPEGEIVFDGANNLKVATVTVVWQKLGNSQQVSVSGVVR
ncbi:hypothetical protein QA601_10780 [Chitinispirillales bacterium ANBcel5]|uniref:type IV pilus modification PilV family protein n=1 Tax=Cellulosispirillum alkaliphilum TaxID=3039283 RepID=UPI002A546A2E|nr:hypothetical protein [Chitinispirillales bacterium ANBcel5]